MSLPARCSAAVDDSVILYLDQVGRPLAGRPGGRTRAAGDAMSPSKKANTKSKVRAEAMPTAARQLAPDDVQPGLYVAVLQLVGQYMPMQCDSTLHPRTEPVDVLWVPWWSNEPLKVLEVCTPFVLARRADRSCRMLDLRRHRLARLDAGYARRVRKRLRAERKQRRDSDMQDDLS
jgi:hypothetical protein